uniref:LexA family transcriptional regulator n=1 Tax=Halomonas sp. TaxID=1486246 RepID=UPI00261F17BB|nr:S24 family peptidase [Halomonas sp.]
MDTKRLSDEVITRLKMATNTKSDSELSAFFGWSKTAMTNKRQRGSVPYDEAVQVSVTQGISLDWLILGKGDAPEGLKQVPSAAFSADDGAPLSVAMKPSPGFCSIPMYDIEAAAGDGRSLEQENIETTLYFEGEQLSAQGLDPTHVVGVKVRGDSMESTLSDGDWVLVDRSDRPDRPEGVFLLLVEGERRIKRVQRVAGGAWMLLSDNSHYQPEMIPPEKMPSVELLGRCVVKIGRIA